MALGYTIEEITASLNKEIQERGLDRWIPQLQQNEARHRMLFTWIDFPLTTEITFDIRDMLVNNPEQQKRLYLTLIKAKLEELLGELAEIEGRL